MTITVNTIVTAAAALTAICAIFGAVFAAYRWYLRQERQDVDIARLKSEDIMICRALSACLDGLQQLGANHTVPVAKKELDEFLNKQAHM